MKATEFRVTNLVMFKNLVINPIIFIGYDSVELIAPNGQTMTAKLDDIQSIPLTEEWLFKLGFEKPFNVALNEYYPDYSFNHFHVDLKIEDNMSVCYICCIKGNFRFVNYHVHQLQNLYFALTGEELEMK